MSSLCINESPDVLQHLLRIRKQQNHYRKILDHLIPQLAAFESLLPSIFDLGSPAGKANRDILLKALEEGDVDAIALLVQSHRPAYDAQRQLLQQRERNRRSVKGDLT